MPTQNGFLLLRMCFFPILNHLLRTMPTGIGSSELEEFDEIIWKTVKDWVRDDTIAVSAKRIVQLPRRLGGLGFFNSLKTRPYAAAASYVLSQGFLKSRNIALTGHLEKLLKNELDLFSEDLGLDYNQLFEGDLWEEEELQRKGAELSREVEWSEVFLEMDNARQVRFLENASVLRRKWMDCMPVAPALTLSDDEVRYGLQESLLGSFPEARSSVTRVCSSCHMEDDPVHHLSCSSTASLRTTRHTAIHYCFEKAMDEVKAGSVKNRPFVGTGRDGSSIFADTAATIQETRCDYDYTVVSSTTQRLVRIPDEGEIMEQIELDKASGTRDRQRFLFWEDHSEEKPHPTTVKIRKLRQMMFQETIGKDLHHADRTKYLHYGHYPIIPVSFTARGAMGRHTCALVDNLCVNDPYMDFPDRVLFRGNLMKRLSVILLRSANLMKETRSRVADEY
jgi:hypothetical protein